MAIILYKVDRSPPVRAVLMTIEILGIEVQTIDVNTFAGEHLKPEYIKKNPIHTVPLLEDGDFILSDSHAIITYLVSRYGKDMKEKLYPTDLKLRATIDQRLFFDTSILFPRLRAIAFPIFRGQKIESKLIEDIEETYGFLEKYLEKSIYLVTDHVTLADVSCVASVSSSNCIVPIDEKYVKLRTWFDRLKGENWYQKGNVPGLNDLVKVIKESLEKSEA
uniref:Glutathione S-transferase 4 n=1 Tax=Streltzoviella insularis TaxID=1206366 RepID=A0A7D5UMU7_9NEOP|nr:glutathione S-transferase 4 [Streltzoviella insularis]